MVNLGASCCTFWAVEPGVSFRKVTYDIMTVSPAKKKRGTMYISTNGIYFFFSSLYYGPLDFSVEFTSTLMDSPET